MDLPWVDQRLNVSTVWDPFPLHFTSSLLDKAAEREIYFFLDGSLGLNQVKMALENRDYIDIFKKSLVFVATIRMFELKHAFAMFQRMVQEIFQTT